MSRIVPLDRDRIRISTRISAVDTIDKLEQVGIVDNADTHLDDSLLTAHTDHHELT